MHPARRDAVQHRQRLVDEVVIVEQPALLLLAAVVRGGRGRDVQQGRGAVAHGHRAALLDQSAEALRLVLEQAGDGWVVIAKLLGQHRLARQLFVGEEDAEIGIDLCGAGKHLGLAEATGLVVVGLAAVFQREGDVVPARPRQERAVENLRLDVLDAIARIHAQHRRHLLSSCLGVAGLVGPGHEMIAAETGLAHDLLEGDVGGARHRGEQRAAGDASPDRARPPAAPSDWRAPSCRSGRARRSRRSAPARWPRTETAGAGACTARGWSAPSARPASPARRRTAFALRGAVFASGCGMPTARIAASSAASSSVTQWPSVVNTRSAMLAAAALVKVMQRIFSGGTPDSSRRITRCTSTWVLPEPALADTKADAVGSDARACRARTSSGMGTRRLHHSSIPSPPAADHSLIRARSS